MLTKILYIQTLLKGPGVQKKTSQLSSCKPQF